MTNDVLIITNYYPPETGAAANRISHLAKGLSQKGFSVSVTTPLPNYPAGNIFPEYRNRQKRLQKENNIKVQRLWVFASASKNKFLRLFAMLSYSFSLVGFFCFNKIPKLVIVQSPPLLVAFTCMLLLRSKKRSLILNVSDLWPLAGLELGVIKSSGLSYRILKRIERFNYKTADLVVGQSQEVIEHVLVLYPHKKTFLYRNFPNIAPDFVNTREPSKKIRVVYAGLLGVAQGILSLCKHLEYSRIELHLYGSGPERYEIEKFLAQNRELPITYHGEISRHELHKAIQQYDLAVIPLKKRIYGSVPSKIFEFALLGMPLLYFGGGEGEEIVNKYRLGWVSNAGDYAALNNIIRAIMPSMLTPELRQSIRDAAMSNFDFNNQLERLVGVIQET